ncbi:hypothetical protein INR49_025441 [Caranx melampygus]|nr:hypothetical protein INR49_025441 [Caranx melampygus]
MSDQDVTPTPSAPPPPPSGPRPKMTNRGRTTDPMATSNSDFTDIPELEYHVAPGPRGYPPMTGMLDIVDVDMMRRPNESNKMQHHTMYYNSDNLIVRRGQEFEVKVTFNRPYNSAQDKIALEFIIGSSPQYSKGTYIPVFPTADRQTSWAGRITSTSGNDITMGITPRADCIVGKYHMYVAVSTPYGIRRTVKDRSRDLYILFNPWAPDDDVFLDDEAEREECVMTEVGIIYHGSFDDVAERNWNYGQFNYGVLDSCLYIMDRAEMPITNRGDPVKITRKASAMLNSRDDEGVMVGNWSGDYTYGVAPTSWTGSTDILLTYSSSKMPVCYAQCWVYAAVFNTFLRCLGIPSRVVTNFYSAHDNNGNLKTDIILDENGRIDRDRTKDSIWYVQMWPCICPGHQTRADMLPLRCCLCSTEERTVLEKAEEYGCKRDKSALPVSDVDVVLPTLEVRIGDDFELAVEFINQSDQKRTVDTYVSGNVVYYTGVTSSEFLFETPTVKIGPNRSVKELVSVKSTKYMKELVEQANLHFIVTGKVKETGQIVTAMKVIALHNPQLLVEVSGGSRIHEEMMVSVQFTNPFTFGLEGVYIRLEGPAMMAPKYKYYSLIPGGSSLTWTEFFTPQRSGTTRMIATLDCAALRQVSGQATFTVKT